MSDYYRKVSNALQALLQIARPTHRHKKGGLYILIGYGTHTETGERLAIYVGLNWRLWCRPADMFDDPARFTPLEDPNVISQN